MGIFKLPKRRMYCRNRTRVSIIADCMSFNQFSKILSLLHFNDNNLIPDVIRFNLLLTTHVNNSKVLLFQKYEQMIPFKGANDLKHYLPKKRKKLGYKLRTFACISG